MLNISFKVSRLFHSRTLQFALTKQKDDTSQFVCGLTVLNLKHKENL